MCRDRLFLQEYEGKSLSAGSYPQSSLSFSTARYASRARDLIPPPGVKITLVFVLLLCTREEGGKRPRC